MFPDHFSRLLKILKCNILTKNTFRFSFIHSHYSSRKNSSDALQWTLQHFLMVFFSLIFTGGSDCVYGSDWLRCASEGGRNRSGRWDLHPHAEQRVRVCGPQHLYDRPESGSSARSTVWTACASVWGYGNKRHPLPTLLSSNFTPTHSPPAKTFHQARAQTHNKNISNLL